GEACYDNLVNAVVVSPNVSVGQLNISPGSPNVQVGIWGVSSRLVSLNQTQMCHMPAPVFGGGIDEEVERMGEGEGYGCSGFSLMGVFYVLLQVFLILLLRNLWRRLKLS
ncbi:MAG: hypothetical protein QXI58_03340, partial [Candidatus Micrarchaeia archaeon]